MGWALPHDSLDTLCRITPPGKHPVALSLLGAIRNVQLIGKQAIASFASHGRHQLVLSSLRRSSPSKIFWS